MVLALLLALSVADWVPARWPSADAKMLELVAETPINCLLLEPPAWSPAFAETAAQRNIVALGVIRPGGDPVEAAHKAMAAKLAGVVLEGEFERGAAARVRDSLAPSKAHVIELPARSGLRLNEPVPVAGTYQGVWPGIHVEEDTAKAMPTGGPWIDTNTGFLRFLRAASQAPVWIANLPPPKTVLPVDRYLQAICDAAIAGARWVVALDDEFSRRLQAREAHALRDWRRIAAHLRYFEEHREWRAFEPYGQLALVQDLDSGALLSGGILDMIAVKHTPVCPVPAGKIDGPALQRTRMAVNVDPASLTPPQKEALSRFARSGGTLLSGPPGWKLPAPPPGQITLDQKELERVNDIWREVNQLIGRRNLGARLFNVSSMLSNLLADPEGKRVVLHLVNYSNYPVEAITVHLLGRYKQARLYSPEEPPRKLETYAVEEGTGVDVDRVSVCATLVLD